MKGEILLKTTYVNATIVTMNEQNKVIENGYIIVENDQIIDVKSGEFANEFEVDEVIDMKGKWVFTRACKYTYTRCNESPKRYWR